METFGLAAVAAVILPFIVNLVKKLSWVGNEGAPIAAFVCGAALGLIGLKFGMFPEDTTTMSALMIGIAVGGTSTGLYAANKLLPKKSK